MSLAGQRTVFSPEKLDGGSQERHYWGADSPSSSNVGLPWPWSSADPLTLWILMGKSLKFTYLRTERNHILEETLAHNVCVHWICITLTLSSQDGNTEIINGSWRNPNLDCNFLAQYDYHFIRIIIFFLLWGNLHSTSSRLAHFSTGTILRYTLLFLQDHAHLICKMFIFLS